MMAAPLIVLLGNDSPALAALHEQSRDAGYRTRRRRACEVTDAHAVVRRADTDLVLLDLWEARREDCWAFLRRPWVDLDTTHLPAIVIAGGTDAPPMGTDLLRTMRCRVVRDPVDAGALLGAIAAALSGSLAGESLAAADGDG